MGIEMAVFAALLVVMALVLIYTLKTGISPHPTSPSVKAALLAALPERLEGDVFELGSGWGTLAFPLAARFPHCRVEAFELSPLPWLVSRLRLLFQPLPNLAIHRRDFHRAPLGGAALVTCYLHPEGMERLKAKFEAELAPGTWVLCNAFAVSGWTPYAEWIVQDWRRSKVYLYKV
ncbi:MAG TPA: class I SAM-dependent methyltransferase [Rhodospirillales bacterium]|nr:class I SAM-dependent methyltransferase [Rhodospirillales bacterium]